LIYLMEGRTDDQKRAVIDKVTHALVEALGTRPNTCGSSSTTCPRQTGALRAERRPTWDGDRRPGSYLAIAA
jgi:hypothetical protein